MVADVDHTDDQLAVIDRINDPVRADAQTEQFSVTFQLLDITALRQCMDGFHDSALLLLGLLFEKLDRCFFIQDHIAHKAMPSSLQTSSSV